MALAGWKTGRLPLREGVDLNANAPHCTRQYPCLPLREGVDLNFSVVDLRTPTICLPLREGVDLNRK